MLEWRAVDERGIIPKKVGVYKVSRWVQPCGGVDARHASFVFNASFVYNTAMLELVSAIRGTHPRIQLTLRVELTSSGNGEMSTIAPTVKGVITVPSAEHESFRSVWYAVERARHARLSRGKDLISASKLTLHVKGNPLSRASGACDSPAWTAVLAAAPLQGGVVRRSTPHFLAWAMRFATEIIVNDDFTVAELFPATATDVVALLAHVDAKTFPVPAIYAGGCVEATAASFCAVVEEGNDAESIICVDGNIL
jgi:hypothetical protein